MLMMSMIIMLIFIIILSYLMMTLNFFISMKMNKNFEKLVPFECGYDILGNYRLPFSLHFYLICLLFLMFDIEISLILPMIGMINFLQYQYYYLMMWILLILLIGTLIEWKEGAFNWTL